MGPQAKCFTTRARMSLWKYQGKMPLTVKKMGVYEQPISLLISTHTQCEYPMSKLLNCSRMSLITVTCDRRRSESNGVKWIVAHNIPRKVLDLRMATSKMRSPKWVLRQNAQLYLSFAMIYTWNIVCKNWVHNFGTCNPICFSCECQSLFLYLESVHPMQIILKKGLDLYL